MSNGVHLGNIWNKLSRRLGRLEGGARQRQQWLRDNAQEVQALVQRTHHAVASGRCDARGLANIIHGAVQCGLRRPQLQALCEAVAEAVPPLLELEFSPQMASNTVWALAAARCPAPRLFDEVADAIVTRPDRLAAFQPQDIANTVWAYAKAEHEHGPLLDELAAAAQRRLAEFSPQHLSNTAWAYASLRWPAPQLFDAIAVATVSPIRSGRTVRKGTRLRVDEFFPQGLANLAWAYAASAHPAAELYDALAEAALPKLEGFSSHSLSFLLAAYARAGHEAPATDALFAAAAPLAAVRVRAPPTLKDPRLTLGSLLVVARRSLTFGRAGAPLRLTPTR